MKHNTKNRPTINPRNLLKASTLRRKHEPDVVVTGQRDATSHGYRIAGTTCKDYETYFEHVGSGQTTDKVVSPKKTRTYRVIGGQGFAILEKDNVQKSVVMVPGHELVIEAGIACQLVTTSTTELDLVITQSAKYESSLKVLEKSTTTSQTDEEQLKSVSHDQAVGLAVKDMHVRARSGKAAEQQRQVAIDRGRPVASAAPQISAAAAFGDPAFAVNLRPSGGSDMRGAEG